MWKWSPLTRESTFPRSLEKRGWGRREQDEKLVGRQGEEIGVF